MWNMIKFRKKQLNIFELHMIYRDSVEYNDTGYDVPMTDEEMLEWHIYCIDVNHAKFVS